MEFIDGVYNNALRLLPRRLGITRFPSRQAIGRALVSYLRPTAPESSLHSNVWECLEIVSVLHRQGFQVDLHDHRNRSVRATGYDLIVDIHDNLTRYAAENPTARRILHATGAHWSTQNLAELQRLEGLKLRQGLSLQPRRQVRHTTSAEDAQFITCIGGDFAQSSYGFADAPIKGIRPSSTLIRPYTRRAPDTRKRILWFGSYGAVHKGLDLALEAMRLLPEHHLIVCGDITSETDFFHCYMDDLTRRENVEYRGWMNVHSPEFGQVLDSCSIFLYPSCSEGAAGTLVQALHGGLVPIATQSSGVDIDQFGVLLPQHPTVEAIVDSIWALSTQLPSELHAASEHAWEFARRNLNRHAFRQDIESAMSNFLKGYYS